MMPALQLKCEVSFMAKFKIPVVPATVNKSIRFPTNIIEAVNKAIEGRECTFTAFVVEAVRVALENLEEELLTK